MQNTVPDSDNCGYDGGMLVHAKEGTVEVRRSDDRSGDWILGVLSAVLKAGAHGGNGDGTRALQRGTRRNRCSSPSVPVRCSIPAPSSVEP